MLIVVVSNAGQGYVYSCCCCCCRRLFLCLWQGRGMLIVVVVVVSMTGHADGVAAGMALSTHIYLLRGKI